jgi:hypothetical protein
MVQGVILWQLSLSGDGKITERLAVSKRKLHRFRIEMFNLEKINKIEGKEQHLVKASNSFSALEDLDADVAIDSAWESIRENINISAKESIGNNDLKKHKSWLDEGSSEVLGQRKEAKLQWLQNSSEINGDKYELYKT